MFDAATARRFLRVDPRARRQPRRDGGVRRVPRPQAARSSRCCGSWGSPRERTGMKIATWNVNSLRVRLPHLTDWLAANPVDVDRAAGDQAARRRTSRRRSCEALGCTSRSAASAPTTASPSSSRRRSTDVVAGIPGFEDEQRRVLAATLGGLRVIDVYVPNGQTVGSDKFDYKLRWLDGAARLRRRRSSRGIRSSSCSATSTSRRRTATCTTRRPGKAPCT